MLNRLHQRLPHLVAIVFTVALVGPAAWIAGATRQASGGYVLERDAEIALEEPGTHGGGGKTIGYSFFKKTPNLKLVFRKRALKPGSGHWLSPAEGRRDLLRAQRARGDDHRREEL